MLATMMNWQQKHEIGRQATWRSKEFLSSFPKLYVFLKAFFLSFSPPLFLSRTFFMRHHAAIKKHNFAKDSLIFQNNFIFFIFSYEHFFAFVCILKKHLAKLTEALQDKSRVYFDAVCCSVFQCVAVCQRSGLMEIAEEMYGSWLLQIIAVGCSELRWVVVKKTGCNVL